MVDIQPYMQRIIERFNNPSIQAGLKGFTRALLFKFTDTNEEYVVRAVDGKQATLTKETIEHPDVTITTTTDILAGVMDHKINAMSAYMQRKIQTKGPMDDLMKMQKLMM
jgi:putative sterol carrier protein